MANQNTPTAAAAADPGQLDPGQLDPGQPLLSQLADIAEPAAISWWPLAPGWWLLMLVIIATLTGLSLLVYRYSKRRRYRREALVELAKLPQPITITAINSLLKQVAMASYGRRDTAALTGDVWLDFLHSKTPSLAMPEAVKQQLADGGYQSISPPHASQAVLDYCRSWIKKHQRGPYV